jgi:hypothetical protein
MPEVSEGSGQLVLNVDELVDQIDVANETLESVEFNNSIDNVRENVLDATSGVIFAVMAFALLNRGSALVKDKPADGSFLLSSGATTLGGIALMGGNECYYGPQLLAAGVSWSNYFMDKYGFSEEAKKRVANAMQLVVGGSGFTLATQFSGHWSDTVAALCLTAFGIAFADPGGKHFRKLTAGGALPLAVSAGVALSSAPDIAAGVSAATFCILNADFFRREIKNRNREKQLQSQLKHL